MLFFLFRVALALAVAIMVGAMSAFYAIDRSTGFGARQFGPWRTYPKRGTEDADPYSKARMAREGIIPLGAAEGAQFIATTDSSGGQLQLDCAYRIEGKIPAARYWTLYPADKNDAPVRSSLSGAFNGLQSRQVLRDSVGNAVIQIGPAPLAGNWIPTSGAGPMILVLTLYDSAITSDLADGEVELPRIEREGCGV